MPFRSLTACMPRNHSGRAGNMLLCSLQSQQALALGLFFSSAGADAHVELILGRIGEVVPVASARIRVALRD